MAMRNEYGKTIIEVTVKRNELLERLKTNREEHQQKFQQAISAWQEDLQKILSTLEPKTCTEFPRELIQLRLECPTSHVQEYEQAIDMFSMCITDEITLDSTSFNTFCRDEWEWKSSVAKNKYYCMTLG